MMSFSHMALADRETARRPFAAALRHGVTRIGHWFATLHPVPTFLLMSGVFGTALVLLVPPMRGPDEPAHFVRAHGVWQGDIVPSIVDDKGRKGVFIPVRFQREMEMFELARHRRGDEDFSYHQVFADYARARRGWEQTTDAGGSAFNLYGGSEGYSPVPYLPYLPAIAVARAAQLDFLTTFYLMRITGFAVLTAIVAYAIAIVPRLRWTFLMIALLPSALYGRSIVSADGAALAFSMIVAALYLRRVYSPRTEGRSPEAFWMVLCVLTKPPQLAFVMLHATGESLRTLMSGWRRVLVILSAVILAVVWAMLSSADVALWRLIEDHERQQFDPFWRIGYLLEHPLHFVQQLAGTLDWLDDYGRQLIGVLGWLDTPLQPFAYPALGILLVASFCVRLELPRRMRVRIAALYATAALTYTAAVFIIFYFVWTPLDADRIQGVQGRYFVVVLPLVAVALSALSNRELPKAARNALVTGSALLSGFLTVEAVLRFDWKLWS